MPCASLVAVSGVCGVRARCIERACRVVALEGVHPFHSWLDLEWNPAAAIRVCLICLSGAGRRKFGLIEANPGFGCAFAFLGSARPLYVSLC